MTRTARAVAALCALALAACGQAGSVDLKNLGTRPLVFTLRGAEMNVPAGGTQKDVTYDAGDVLEIRGPGEKTPSGTYSTTLQGTSTSIAASVDEDGHLTVAESGGAPGKR
jgi:hypothetical protein